MEKLLFIGSHLDDIEIAAGGTVAKAIQKGHVIKTVIMSKSDYTNYDGKILRTWTEAHEEGIEALHILGVTDIDILSFSVKDTPYDSSSIEALNKIMDKFQPTQIITHWPFDTHQSHRNTALASISAGRNFNNILMYESFPPSGRSYVAFKPQVYSDITDVLALKMQSLKAHKSQYKKYGELWIDAVIGRAQLRGWECGNKYAECFELLRSDLIL